MNIKNRTSVIGGVLAVILVIVTVLVLYTGYVSNNDEQDHAADYQEVSVGDPVDIVLDFYNPWLEAVKSTSTDPYTAGFSTSRILSQELRDVLALSQVDAGGTNIDPVLCQSTVPERVSGRIVSQQDDMARVLVMAKEKELTAQSVFVLKRATNGWYIDSIRCSPGEFGPAREFSFEKEGYILKRVPAPFDAAYWHIVFEENGEHGHVAPLFFDATSSCTSLNSGTTMCLPDQFTEATKIHVYGQMTEAGVAVTRLEFLE